MSVIDYFETRDRIVSLLDKELFRAWLEAKPTDAVVGKPADSTSCPIAQYLRYTLGVDADITVNCEDTIIVVPELDEALKVYNLDWELAFIQGIDNINTEEVDPATCILVLDTHIYTENNEEDNFNDNGVDKTVIDDYAIDDWENDEDDFDEDNEYDERDYEPVE